MTITIKQSLKKTINAQLSSLFLYKEPNYSQRIETKTFTQQRKKLSAKKLKKETLQLTKNLTPLQGPSQIEVNSLLENYQNKYFDIVENIAQKLIQKYPDHQLSYVVLGSVFKQTGRYQESLVLDEKWVSLSPSNAESHSNLGDTLRELGRLTEAVASYEKAIEAKRDYSEAYYKIGNILMELGQLEDAAMSYKKSIEIDSSFAESYSNLGITLAELGRLIESAASYEKAIAIKPDYAEAHNNLGVTLQKLGRQKDAESCFGKAILIKPNYAQAYFNLGITLAELGRLIESAASYEKAIAIKPDYAEAHNNLGITLRKLGRQKDSESCYRKAILIKPNYAQAYFNLGNTLKELGSLKDALGNYKIAIAIDSGFAEKCDHIIATINGLNPLRASDAYVAELFDGYAKDFESSLVGKLNYKTPTIIADYLKLLIPFKNIKLDILDLGCGTGLAGEVLIDLAKNLVGIDLSKEMLKLASAKNIYDRLVHSEIHHALNNEQDESFDVIVSSDVFVYIGDLKEIFDGVHNILKVGGFFAYSVEALNSMDNIEKILSSSDYQLNDNGRYSHSSSYLMNLIDPKKFTLHKLKLEQIRLEKGLPVMGYVVVMQKSS
jgi:predicted TPR repeat methyltransferase